jgi:hypothetical protein
METEEAEVALLDKLDTSICSRVQDWRGISASPSFDNLLALTIRCGMTHYVEQKVLQRKGFPMPELLDLALQAKVVIDVDAWSIQATNTIDLSMVQLLLEVGLNPNDRSSQAERTAWGRFLQRLSPPVQSRTKSASRRLNNVYEACQLMINSGAGREVEFLNRTTEKLEMKRVEDVLGAIFRLDEVQSLMALYTSREINLIPMAGSSILTRVMKSWWG